MDADVVEIKPRPGTLAWLRTHDLIERDGVLVPSCHRIPEHAELCAADDTPRCRVTVDGERCKGTRLIAYGLCMGHAGGGGTRDLPAMQEKSTAKRQQLRLTKQVLGIGPKTAANPRAVMRLLAAQRANELASAVVDGPLDADLGPIERQKAALAALDATFPLEPATLQVELGDPESMSWEDMQRLASSLLG